MTRLRAVPPAGLGLAALLLLAAVAAPGFFSAANLRDLIVNNAPVFVAAMGTTLVIVAGHIDISIGAQFAICSVAAGLLANAGLPMPLVGLGVALIGGAMGVLNGSLVAGLGLPSIVVTLATMVALRDALRWTTEGAWVRNLPGAFQWAGLGQSGGQVLIASAAAALLAGLAWTMRNLAAGRHVYAVGSSPESARLAGIAPGRIVFGVFASAGALTGLAALLSSLRFSEIQGNAGVGLEMKVIAAVVVGGASITGGRGTLLGTLLGVALLGAIGTALTFLGISSYWEKAIQGAIILAAVVGGRKQESR